METVVNNAGVVILGVFLKQFFERLDLAQDDSFVSYEAQNRGVYLIQYLVSNRIDFSEQELVLNKFLVGLQPEDQLDAIDEITAKEKEMCNSLMDGLIGNWDKIKDSSVEAIQISFLQRDGMLQINPESLVLMVERKGIDVLVDTIPWNISIIKFPWMEKPLQVNW